jgi:hypothetical protein
MVPAIKPPSIVQSLQVFLAVLLGRQARPAPAPVPISPRRIPPHYRL